MDALYVDAAARPKGGEELKFAAKVDAANLDNLL